MKDAIKKLYDVFGFLIFKSVCMYVSIYVCMHGCQFVYFLGAQAPTMAQMGTHNGLWAPTKIIKAPTKIIKAPTKVLPPGHPQ